ncbi:hypothetical protein LO762_32070 [Actinocorallia sp. API 0066]|uniref:hypothetical protein n=1 Tax=Actinocorallia sp. API 0066 TaxID=2896846 RepID=UPI001E59C764|nr:hypothetical protein [Actinocorallia sp. API 0066]MCD0453787.1 hypothetical protein [Actinocorallia sp. API 0066]
MTDHLTLPHGRTIDPDLDHLLDLLAFLPEPSDHRFWDDVAADEIGEPPTAGRNYYVTSKM